MNAQQNTKTNEIEQYLSIIEKESSRVFDEIAKLDSRIANVMTAVPSTLDTPSCGDPTGTAMGARLSRIAATISHANAILLGMAERVQL